MLDRKKSLDALIDAQNEMTDQTFKYWELDAVIMAIGLKQTDEEIREKAKNVNLEGYLHDSK